MGVDLEIQKIHFLRLVPVVARGLRNVAIVVAAICWGVKGGAIWFHVLAVFLSELLPTPVHSMFIDSHHFKPKQIATIIHENVRE